MTIRTEPIPARTDNPSPATRRVPVRPLALALTAGTLVWAGTMFTVGNNPASSLGLTISDLGGAAFQLGLFALLAIQLRTSATGTSRAARGMLYVEHVLLAVATVWSVLHAIPSLRDAAFLVPMDVFWPLSMLGMFVIGLKILFTARWRGAARFWPAVAESWAVVTVPTFAVVGSPIADYVGATHLLVGYATLGLILAFRPALTGAGA
ncbi:hypothetical protein [Dactylosporangium matsuzakiense]|uniref:Uncharacterized protein n=1 Tax=Dactylosporangium matsuzakiense TaxID=53360 RepID=A0A9W6KE26_9ACTN|nr:hypothetical protein [Dactylosporangium matsuzakiense]UWZ47215.1 hypothetical protein Dmats_12880 [Dactylosporangium matsuzakiense]GLK98339.1 hypothetical protein GCM10017581_000800 [Dactylosporangium matsuzakiense]